MKIVFLLGSPNISGGTYVIFEHATRIQRLGHEVYILTEEKVHDTDINWHTNAKSLHFITYNILDKKNFDIAIATWWKTIFLLHLVSAEHYVYFVQSIESKFYPESEKALRQLVESTYTLDLPVITEATWIKTYLESTYFNHVHLVHNGIRKDLYNTNIKPIEPKTPHKLRVLVEGPLGVPFKNVEKTIALCLASNASEIWLMTSSPISSYSGVDKVFSQIPINKAATIYRACDVVVKLSYVEGMFGPPLEMFHCGGTAIVYNVTGFDEYIINNYNAIVIQRDDEKGVIEAINRLSSDSLYLEKLKNNAKITANTWIDWDKSSKMFLESLNNISNSQYTKISHKRLGMLTQFHDKSYVISETSKLNNRHIKNKIQYLKIKIKNRFPKSYILIKKYYYELFKKSFK